MKTLTLKITDLAQAEDCVFLDTAQSGSAHEPSWFFINPESVITAWSIREVEGALQQVETLSRKFWMAGYLRYEAAAAFLPFDDAGFQKSESVLSRPLLWFGAYRAPMKVEMFQAHGGYIPWRRLTPGLGYHQYRKIIQAVKAEIQAGNTYQVNFTFDCEFQSGASMEYLYAYLRGFQPAPYAAFIKNSTECVLSFSPELFFQRDGLRIWTRPMKGTAARGADADEDFFKKTALHSDEKNRAENLMIVDLLRNDLGRIARAGTVAVPSMFDIETYPTVHQMTSRIEAELRCGTGYQEIFRALFPCGSVTGAPKIRTMEIIARLEQGARGIYCGAIGYTAPGGKSVWSVPIRILQKHRNDRHWQYRVGSGIVWDSEPAEEWREAAVKTAFLTAGEPPELRILETFLRRNGSVAYENAHYRRMKSSARKLKIPFDDDGFKSVMTRIGRSVDLEGEAIVRLFLDRSGGFSFEYSHFDCSLPDQACLSVNKDARLDSANEWLRHKTTYRPWYEDTMIKIKNGEIWDEVFFNEREEVCEGARSNIFAETRGVLYTPPVSCGLLPGVFRAHLLRRGRCFEKILTLRDLTGADAVYCGNSVRGLVKVKILI